MDHNPPDAPASPPDTGLGAFYREMTLPERRTFWGLFLGLGARRDGFYDLPAGNRFDHRAVAGGPWHCRAGRNRHALVLGRGAAGSQATSLTVSGACALCSSPFYGFPLSPSSAL